LGRRSLKKPKALSFLHVIGSEKNWQECSSSKCASIGGFFEEFAPRRKRTTATRLSSDMGSVPDLQLKNNESGWIIWIKDIGCY